jgi:hypothetical protein
MLTRISEEHTASIFRIEVICTFHALLPDHKDYLHKTWSFYSSEDLNVVSILEMVAIQFSEIARMVEKHYF